PGRFARLRHPPERSAAPDRPAEGVSMSSAISAPPEQGQLVQVRSRPWVVNVVKPSSLPSPALQLPGGGTQNLLTLSSVEDDGLGEEIQIVWEIEPGAKIVEKVA